MSLDGAFGSIGSAGIYHVLDLINGTDTLQAPIPAGNLYYTGLDFNAKVLWSATSLTANRFELGVLLKTQGIPLGSNRNLTGGGLLPCTDAQGHPSSSCTGNADPLPDPGTGTGTETQTGTTTSSSTTQTGTTTGSGTTTQTGTTTGMGTNSTNSTSGMNGTTDGEGGGGLVDLDSPQTLPWLVVVAVAVAGGATLLLVYARRRTP
ncbi:MAG: hypothetical protein LC623_02275 [Halobacteriales archaeon]|nr:hypothetical protein [Halobacteriales archaeon]